jgi:lysophospholipase L1-like esterase
MTRRRLPLLFAIITASLLLALGACTTQTRASAASAQGATWVATWSTSETAPVPNASGFKDQTLRLIAHTTLGGDQVRIRLSNVFGIKPLVIGSAGVGLQATGAALAPGSHRPLTFGGRSGVTIPPAAVMLSDPIDLSVAPQSNLSISLFLPGDSGAATVHPGATQTSYVSGEGDFVARTEAAPFAQTLQTWPFLAGIEVRAKPGTRVIVAFGDSITDGFKSTVDANRRWPDYLSRRLLSAGSNVAIVNQGISGNRILHDALAGRPIFGPNALSRFDRNVLAISGATHVVVLIGINDIGMGSPERNAAEVVSAEDIIVGLRQLAARARARGLKVIGATLTPFAGAGYFSAQGEEKRQAVNAWIRSAKDFDGFIDFDAATRDPAKPTQFLPAYDSGDHLHPNDAGYEAMAKGVDLKLFD